MTHQDLNLPTGDDISIQSSWTLIFKAFERQDWTAVFREVALLPPGEHQRERSQLRELLSDEFMRLTQAKDLVSAGWVDYILVALENDFSSERKYALRDLADLAQEYEENFGDLNKRIQAMKRNLRGQNLEIRHLKRAESRAMRLVKQKNENKLDRLVLQAANEGFKEKLERVNAEKEIIRAAHEDILGKWRTQRALNERLQQKLKEQEGLVEKSSANIVDGEKFQNAIAAFENERIGYEAAIKKMDADNQVKQKTLDHQKQKLSELEANLAKAKIAIQKQDKEQKDFDADYRRQADKIALYEAELEKLKAKIESLNAEAKKRISPALRPVMPANSAELDALRSKLKYAEEERDNNLRIIDELYYQLNDLRAKEAADRSSENLVSSKKNKCKPADQDQLFVSRLREIEKNTLRSPTHSLPVKNDKPNATSSSILSYVYLPELLDLPPIDKKTFYTFPPILLEFALSGSFDPMLLSIHATTRPTGFGSRVDLKGEFSFVNSDTVIFTHQPGVWYILIKDVCQAAPNFKVGKAQFDKLLGDIRIEYNKKAFQLGEVNIAEAMPHPFKSETEAFTHLTNQKRTNAKKLRNPICALFGHTINADTKKVNYRVGDRFPDNALRYSFYWVDQAAETEKRKFPPALVTPKFTYRQLEDKEYWQILSTDEFLNRVTPAKEL